MERDKPEQSDEDQGFVHRDPVMDAALNWLFMLQAAPDDEMLRREFEAWRSADSGHARTFSTVADVWELPELDLVASEVAGRGSHAGSSRGAVVAQYKRSPRNIWTRAVMAAAAAVMIALGIQQYPALLLQWQADYITVTGARDEIMLPDGSRMVLNTASAVSLDFEGAKRAVTLLQGEAFFDVVSDPTRPFTVASTFSEVEVTGTAFSVRTQGNQDTVVLERGLVDVERLAARSDIASLEPGESITATAAALSAARKTDTATALAWLDGRVVFEDQLFGEVLEEVGRYYGGSIIVVSNRLGQVRINGSYRLDSPERAVRSLATAAGASVTRLPGGILILR